MSVGVSGGQGLCSCPCCAAEPAAATASPPMTRNKAQALPWRLPLPLLCFWFCGAGRGTGWACVPRLVPCRGLGGSGRSGVWAAYGLQTKVFFILFLLDAWGLAGAHGQNPEAGAPSSGWAVAGQPGAPRGAWMDFFPGHWWPSEQGRKCRRPSHGAEVPTGRGSPPAGRGLWMPAAAPEAAGSWGSVEACVNMRVNKPVHQACSRGPLRVPGSAMWAGTWAAERPADSETDGPGWRSWL